MNIKNSDLDLVNYGIWYEPFWKTRNFYILASILIFLLLLLFSILIIKKIKKLKIKKMSPSEKFDYEINLLSSCLNDPKIFYIKLILIFKDYLSGSFNCDLHNLTDYEMIDYLRSLNLSPQVTNIDSIINHAQIVKFAKSTIDKNQMVQDLLLLKTSFKSIESYKSDVSNTNI